MYKTKPCASCDMPAPGTTLKALAFNASLKHGDQLSNTEELARLVLENMKSEGVESEIIRLSDRNIPAGLGFRESKDDDWPALVEKMKAADIVLFCTPIWWGGRSSLMQRLIERLDALDEEY
ncbi:MAG: flavodoxin family protein, partial [Candidatus Binatia bacterium]